MAVSGRGAAAVGLLGGIALALQLGCAGQSTVDRTSGERPALASPTGAATQAPPGAAITEPQSAVPNPFVRELRDSRTGAAALRIVEPELVRQRRVLDLHLGNGAICRFDDQANRWASVG